MPKTTDGASPKTFKAVTEGIKMAEKKPIEVKLVREERPIICGLTYTDLRRVEYIHSMVDTLHSMCEIREGMSGQVKPAASFKIAEACTLRDFTIENGNKLLTELLEKAKKNCPR